MKNRIRIFRRQRGMTLRQLAEAVGTTPQTISRLETQVMTLSADWLERLANIFGVHPTELLETPDRPEVQLLGLISGDGSLSRTNDTDCLVLDIGAERPVAVKLAQAYGPYRSGEILIANRLEGDDLENALSRDCLCCMTDGRIFLRRVIRGAERTYTLVPLESGGDVRHNQYLKWAARIIMRVQWI